VKESEICNLSSAPRSARYRYFSNPPTTVWLRLADIASQIPEAARLPAFDVEHSIELPCEDVFAGPVPKLLLSRLAEIAGEHVRFDSVPDSLICLPAAQLALGYHFINGCERLEESALAENGSPISEEWSYPPEGFAPKVDISEPQESSIVNKGDGGPPRREVPIEEVKTARTIVGPPGADLAPVAAANAPPEDPPLADGMAPSETTKVPLDATKVTVAPAPLKEAQARQEGTPSAVAEGSAAGPPTTPAPETWRPISIFPIFRRKVVEPQAKPPAPPHGPHDDLSKPREAFVYPEFSSRAAPSETEPRAVEPSVKESASASPAQEAVLVEVERLPKFESRRSAEIPDQDALQAMFMTEEFLSVERVVELSGGLPGIKSCVLAHGSAVLASHNVPESIDLVSLSAHALEMLAAMRQSAARMGVGAVPAVTIHSEKGPITFFHQDDLCLLVLHKDRGFVPGVREKLQKVVECLSETNLILPVAASRPALAPKEATF
jgi:predicted regulator of Ras-like GTPase activity (Roadblock/LC7/MglB family)